MRSPSLPPAARSLWVFPLFFYYKLGPNHFGRHRWGEGQICLWFRAAISSAAFMIRTCFCVWQLMGLQPFFTAPGFKQRLAPFIAMIEWTRVRIYICGIHEGVANASRGKREVGPGEFILHISIVTAAFMMYNIVGAAMFWYFTCPWIVPTVTKNDSLTLRVSFSSWTVQDWVVFNQAKCTNKLMWADSTTVKVEGKNGSFYLKV